MNNSTFFIGRSPSYTPRGKEGGPVGCPSNPELRGDKTPLNVLLVADGKQMLCVLDTILRTDRGLNIKLAHSQEDAEKALRDSERNGRFDLVIVDNEWPVNGFDIAKANLAIEDENLRARRIVLLAVPSLYEDAHIPSQLIKKGVGGVVEKPFDIGVLDQLVADTRRLKQAA